MQPESVGIQQKQELLRARAFGNVSGAGIGGVSTTTSPNQNNPLTFQGNVPATVGGGGESPTDQAQKRLGQDKGEAKGIVTALSQRLKALTQRGE